MIIMDEELTQYIYTDDLQTDLDVYAAMMALKGWTLVEVTELEKPWYSPNVKIRFKKGQNFVKGKVSHPNEKNSNLALKQPRIMQELE